MISIEKKYHFHAAHRNEKLDDKCRNLHGHTYHVVVRFNSLKVTDESGVSIKFADLDAIVEPIIKDLDHTTLIHENDLLLRWIKDFNERQPDLATSVKEFPYVTSAENIAAYILNAVKYAAQDAGYKGLQFEVSLQETTSSIVHFSYEPS